MRTRNRANNRRGAATAEFAICLPILVFLILGLNETCSAIFLKEQITIAAYEGARIGIERQSTDAMVRQGVISFLDSRSVTYDATNVVSISTPGFDTAQAMDHVTTTVTVPVAGNSLVGQFFTTQNVSASIVMRKEYTNQVD